MKKEVFSIGDISKRTNCKVETIHYYEKIKIMHEVSRTSGGHRIYSLVDIKRLNFIRKCRNLGFSIEQIRGLLKFIDEPNHYCTEVKDMSLIHLAEVQKKMAELKQLQDALESMIMKCKGEKYTIDDCPIIEALYDE